MSAPAFVRQKLKLLIAPRNFEACRMRTLAQAPAQSVLSAGLDLQQNLPEGGFVGSEHRWWPCVERRCWSRKNVLHLVGHLRTLFHHDRQRTERHLLNLFILPTSREELIEKMDWSRSHSVCSFYRHWFWAPLQEYVSCAHFSPNRHGHSTQLAALIHTSPYAGVVIQARGQSKQLNLSIFGCFSPTYVLHEDMTAQ